MLFYPDFIYVHLPKTGGTFIEKVLLDVYDRSLSSSTNYTLIRLIRRLMRVRDGRLFLKYGWFRKLVYHVSNQIPIELYGSGRRRNIPPLFRDRCILGTIRNPYDYYVSAYLYGSWKFGSVSFGRKIVPKFPDLSFGEFLHYICSLTHNPPKSRDIARLSVLLLDFYTLADDYWSRITPQYLAQEQYREELAGVHFLRTNRLNQDLYEFLLQRGYPKEHIEHIVRLDKILPKKIQHTTTQRSEKHSWEKYYTPELKQLVRQHDELVFKLFPEFDV
jgi:hypothetical protein